MGWRAIHRWLGLTLGTLALVLGLSGTLLALDPVREAAQASPAPAQQDVATLVTRVQRAMPGVEEIRRLPSGRIAAFGFAGEEAQARYVDPASGRLLAAWQPSASPRWVKNLHRALLLGDAGRWGVAATALALALLCASGLVLLLARMGGWRRVAGPVRGTLAARLHVLTGRVLLAFLLLSSVTGLMMSASTLGLVTLDAASEPELASGTGPGRAAMDIAALTSLPVSELRRVNLPDRDDPSDTWQLMTDKGQAWIDRSSGALLAWQDATLAQQVSDWARTLHTGESAWPWALMLGISGASVLLFWASGVLLWWQARLTRVRIAGNAPLAQAQTLIFVASEGGSTWGFAQALHRALAGAGQRVHTAGLEHFEIAAATQQVFILAATWGEGQAPTHSTGALARIAAHAPAAVPVSVLGFGDRQYPAFCGFAVELERVLRERGWPALLALECVHQQSAQQFARWGEALARALGQPLTLDYTPRLPPTTALTLTSRRDYPADAERPAALLRFTWPRAGLLDRLRGKGLARFAAGDLVGIVAPGSGVPRYYSLASSSTDGFLEICVRQWPGGLCSTHLLGLQAGDAVQAFIRPNPGFALVPGQGDVLLIGAGTGVAPLAGFIRANHARRPMHLYRGARSPAGDDYFNADIVRWQDEQRLVSAQAAYSRTSGGYVQDTLRRDTTRLRELLGRGASVRVCGSRPMAQGVAEVLDAILAPLNLSVRALKAGGRYAEDVF